MPDDIPNLPDEDHLNRKIKQTDENLEHLEEHERLLRAKLEHVRDVEAKLIGDTAISRFGPWNEITNAQIKERIEQEHDRVAALVAIYDSLAIHAVLASHSDKWFSLEEIAVATDLSEKATLTVVQSVLTANELDPANAWIERQAGRYRVTKRFANEDAIVAEFDGTSVMTAAGRIEAAKRYCKSLGIAEQDMIRVSPALELIDNFARAATKRHEDGMLRIVNLKRPTWAGARGFNEGYADCVDRARMVKNSSKGFEEFDGLTQMYCYTGACMYDAHVLTMTSAQVCALPRLEGREKGQFIEELHFPFEPNFFLDFSADGNLPSFKSEIAKDGLVSVAGALFNRWDNNILVTPIMVYDSLSEVRESTVPLGMVVYNQKDEYTFHWAGLNITMEKSDVTQVRGTVIVAHTDILDRPEHAGLSDEYRRVLQEATATALDSLYMLEAANVETVERTLERRDAKRAEKRGWQVPSTVRVIRNRRRKNGSSQPTGETRDYTHQFPVRGFYRHVTKGSHVRCPICKGKPIETGCSHCSNTGLDPNKVKPCARIDVTTGKQTCPQGCRREWTPDHIRGPEDAPLLIKTHDIKDAA
jgi:hypothetical protein